MFINFDEFFLPACLFGQNVDRTLGFKLKKDPKNRSKMQLFDAINYITSKSSGIFTKTKKISHFFLIMLLIVSSHTHIPLAF